MAATAPIYANPFAGLIGYQVRRLSLAMMADLADRLEPIGLRPTEASVLFVIAAQPGATQSDIGRFLGVKRANMAPLIAGLEARGLVSRQPMDGRSQALRLTSEGETVRVRAKEATTANELACFGTLPEAERHKLSQLLHGLWEQLEG